MYLGRVISILRDGKSSSFTVKTRCNILGNYRIFNRSLPQHLSQFNFIYDNYLNNYSMGSD